jgi:hypothetical protein
MRQPHPTAARVVVVVVEVVVEVFNRGMLVQIELLPYGMV